MTHICVSKLTIIGSDNGLSPGRRQAIIWTIDGILLIRTLGTNFSEILSEIHLFSFKKMHLKMSSAKWRLFCLGLNTLKGSIVQVQVSIWRAVWTPRVVMTSYCAISDDKVGIITVAVFINTLRPRENGRHFADDIFKHIFSNENVWISIKV